jgi:hypothetical protein
LQAAFVTRSNKKETILYYGSAISELAKDAIAADMFAERNWCYSVETKYAVN